MNRENDGLTKPESNQPIFGDEAGGKKVRAGGMSMIVGLPKNSESVELELEEDNYPAVPAGAANDYDSWLG